jgi:acetyl-CoA carboxylase carboxyl transferase subunit beta
MVDMVVHRHQMRSTLAELCRLLTKMPPAPPRPSLPVPVAEAEPSPAEAPEQS